MSSPYFRFKPFSVWHDRSAMKVGTDGVLLGAWTPVQGRRRILDVGTGSGLIAMMLSWREPQAYVVGIEIDEASAQQAKENVERWPDQADHLRIVCGDFLAYRPDEPFDLIVSNPPFFTETLHSPDQHRSQARHAGRLNFSTLLAHSAELLSDDGTLALIFPANAEPLVSDAARACGLSTNRRTQVFTTPAKPCRRLLMAFGKQPATLQADDLCLTDDSGRPTNEYRRLTDAFYLDEKWGMGSGGRGL